MHSKIKRTILLLVAVCFIAGSGMLLDPIHEMRVEYGLTSQPVEGMSPQLVLVTSMLGAFRGVLVDVMWIRAEMLKQSGKFFEMVQLADWACMLAPRFPKVWEYNAWNMAYNVSVEFTDLTERWAWIKAGMELLRDKAIPLNPDEPRLYRNLASIFFMKIGQTTDEAHAIYKQEWGREMHRVLGGSGTKEQLAEFAKAPHTDEELLKDPSVKALHEKCLQKKFNLLESQDFFEWVERPDSVAQDLKRLLKSPAEKDTVKRIDSFIRAKRLREDYKLDPELMVTLVDKYGPFDWRSPYPHAIYWGARGREVHEKVMARLTRKRREFSIDPNAKDLHATEKPENVYIDIFHDRMVYMSLQQFVRQGRLLFDTEGRLMPIRAPDYRFVDPMIELFESMIVSYKGRGVVAGISASYMFFLNNMALEYYLMGNKPKSEEFWQRLNRAYPLQDWKDTYDEFIVVQFKKYVEDMGPDDGRRTVRLLLGLSYYSLACNADGRAQQLESKAKGLAETWNRLPNRTLRWSIPFEGIRESVLVDVLGGRAGWPPHIRQNLVERLGGPEKVKRYVQAAKRAEKKTIDIDEVKGKFKEYAPPE